MPIVIGIFISTLINHACTGAVGGWITRVLGENVLLWILDAVFIAMATCMQISDRLDAYRSSWHTGYGTDLPGNGRADTAGLGKVIRYLGP